MHVHIAAHTELTEVEQRRLRRLRRRRRRLKAGSDVTRHLPSRFFAPLYNIPRCVPCVYVYFCIYTYSPRHFLPFDFAVICIYRNKFKDSLLDGYTATAAAAAQNPSCFCVCAKPVVTEREHNVQKRQLHSVFISQEREKKYTRSFFF